MKKLSLLLWALAGGLILALLIGAQPVELAAALESTPTPTAVPIIGPDDKTGDPSCHISTSEECDLIDPITERPVVITTGDLPYKQYPAVSAQGVPTSTLVSIIFDRNIDASTINSETFYLSQGSNRLDGAVVYIDAGKIAIFHPAAPLLPSTPYTATVTRSVRDLSGQSLVQDMAWSFTTTSGVSPLNQALERSGAALPGSGMNIYFGDLHSHSLLSDGWGTAEEAFYIAQAVGLDFFALTDHCFMLTPAEWQTISNAANAATSPYFVGLRGFEYSHLYGHINVFNTDNYVSRDDPNYDGLDEFYAWLVQQPTAIAQFNHPLVTEWHDWNFNDFAYNPAVDHKIVLRELSNASQYFLSLDTGWHLGSVGNSDAHNNNFGERRMGILAPVLTRETVLAALKARRTFFASPSDLNFAVVMQANGSWMGSAVPDTGTLNFIINAYDPDPTGKSLRLNLYNNGVLVASASLPGQNLYTWTPSVPASLGHYYYVEAYHDHWLYPAYSSPIWVEQPPIAKTGPAQVVTPGTVVTLPDYGSYDPDGDALIHQWTQQAGPAVTLNNAHQPAATFVANTVGDLVFDLTVADPGGQSDSETTTVTVTDKPILSITKTGPAVAGPGELITYMLTVINNGIAPAQGVVVTDVVPGGATYVSGGTLANNVVSWTIPDLPANGGAAQVSFAVTAAGPITNSDYGASCPDCIPARGQVSISTNSHKIYVPVLQRND
jgi:uncharacterized repeat protein (TIGR01451 family)